MPIVSGAQHQLKRGTPTLVNAYVGAVGEITNDTTVFRVCVNDGATPGGFPTSMAAIAFAGGGGNPVSAFTLPVYSQVLFVSSTVAPTITLPFAGGSSGASPGQRYTFIDSGFQAASFNVSVAAASSTEKIANSAGTLSTTFAAITVAGTYASWYPSTNGNWYWGG